VMWEPAMAQEQPLLSIINHGLIAANLARATEL
jgi:hypothetical protein